MFTAPFINERGSPIADLAAIVRCLDEALYDHAKLGALLDAFPGAAHGLFSGAAHVAARGESATFVAVAARGCTIASVRRWTLFPLERLFLRMHPAVIEQPLHDGRALAIPLIAPRQKQRSVVLAPISRRKLGADDQAFLDALQAIRIPESPEALEFSDEIPILPVDPCLLNLEMCPPLRHTVEAMLARRGWSVVSPSNYAELAEAIAKRTPDLVLFDAAEVPDPAYALTRFHHLMGRSDTKVIAFCDGARLTLERQTLADCALSHDADEAEIFAALKRLVRGVPHLRRSRMRSLRSAAEAAMLAAATPQELSLRAAHHASEVMHGWASVHFVAESGAVYAAEYPRTTAPLLRAIPKTFLSDMPLFVHHVDERFYAEMSDDGQVRSAIERLAPFSAASIPLREGSRRVGALVSVSQGRPADSASFEALEHVARTMTQRFHEFELPMSGGALLERNGVWECRRNGNLDIVAYRSHDCWLVWDYRSLTPLAGLLTVGYTIDEALLQRVYALPSISEASLGTLLANNGKERQFIASLNAMTGTVSYAARGFPAPLLFDVAGPAGMVSGGDEITRGTVSIAPPAGLLVWDEALRRWLLREGASAQSLTEVMEDLRPPGLAVIVTMGTAV